MPSRAGHPMCGAELGPSWVDRGTTARTRSDPPGVTGLSAGGPAQTLALPSDLPHRLLLGAQNGLPHVAPEVREQIASLLTLENFAFLAAFIAADIAFAGTGVGTVLNVVAGGLVVVFVGTQAVSGGAHLISFYRKAATATTAEDFNAAGKEFARAVTLLGVATLVAMVSRRAVSRSYGTVNSIASRARAEASWRALADAIKFDIKANEGAIFAGLKPAELAETIAKSKNPQAKIINDVAKRYGWTEENMVRDFGTEHSATTYRLWESLSIRYQQSLKGRVTAYVDMSKVRLDGGIKEFGHLNTRVGAGRQVEMTDGRVTPSVILTELEQLMTANKNVTSIVLKDINTGETWIYASGAKSGMSH